LFEATLKVGISALRKIRDVSEGIIGFVSKSMSAVIGDLNPFGGVLVHCDLSVIRLKDRFRKELRKGRIKLNV
jgi:hypothetical protein